MRPDVVVAEARDPWIEDLPVEIVERKGIGHPDSLCDGIAERTSRDYGEWCERNLGGPLHHNFDKVLLAGGEVEVGFGGGRMLRPVRIFVAGRATTSWRGRPVPVGEIALGAARAHLRETMRHLDPDRHCAIECVAGRGSGELVDAVARVRANDTSFGVGHWPPSALEECVLRSARFLDRELLLRLPIGEDVKVMGLRRGGEVRLTIAAPLLAREVPDAAAYDAAREAVAAALLDFASRLLPRHRIGVEMNAADDPARGARYLTLTGTSAEMGDDGEVGRGNRVNGLIAPFRPASLEAAAGKNPISHVGKLYNLMALRGARRIVEGIPGVREARVFLLSQIGRPLDEPLCAEAVVRMGAAPLAPAVREEAARLLRAELADPDSIRRGLRAGTLPVF